MNRFKPILFSAIFLLYGVFPCQVLAASIKEKQAAIGYGCTAIGDYSTAMGFHTRSSGLDSTAMGYYTIASGNDSTAMGYYTTASGLGSTAMGYRTAAGGNNSWAGGRYMQLTDTADHTFFGVILSTHSPYQLPTPSSSSLREQQVKSGLGRRVLKTCWIWGRAREKNWLFFKRQQVLTSMASAYQVIHWNFTQAQPQALAPQWPSKKQPAG
jgi:hypothetical protein